MGLFNMKPRNAEERKEYEAELARARGERVLKAHDERIEKLRAKARTDAMPRHERAMARLRGIGAKLDRFEQRAAAKGQGGGIIQQSMAQDKAAAGGSIQESLRADLQKKRRLTGDRNL